MIPVMFDKVNSVYQPPTGYAESQVGEIPAHVGTVNCSASSLDGAKIVVVAWKPTPEELKALNAGNPVFVTCLGGLPAMMLTTDFNSAINPK